MYRIKIDIPPHSPSHPTPPPPMYIGGWGVEGCKRPAGDARDAHAHARYWFYIWSCFYQDR